MEVINFHQFTTSRPMFRRSTTRHLLFSKTNVKRDGEDTIIFAPQALVHDSLDIAENMKRKTV